jgi:hypothetical protein
MSTSSYEIGGAGGRAGVAPKGRLVEMTWDPITRIIGNLGIYTKIDFAERRVVGGTARGSDHRRGLRATLSQGSSVGECGRCSGCAF